MYPERRGLRLREYDYTSAGVYFVTICVAGRLCTRGDVVGGEVQLSPSGGIVAATWRDIPAAFGGVELDELVVMPNHVHGLVGLTGNGPPLGEVIRWFKAKATRLARDVEPTFAWQRNYYERIVRSEAALEAIRTYVTANRRSEGEDPENASIGRSR